MKAWDNVKLEIIAESQDKLKKAVLKLLEPKDDALILDLGCGDDMKFASSIKAHVGIGTTFQGIDITFEGYPEDKSITMLAGDLNEPFPVGSDEYEVVVALQIIEHLKDPEGFLLEVFRVLSPNGYAIISTPNLDSRNKAVTKGEGHVNLFAGRYLTELLDKLGFKIDSVVGTGYLPLAGRSAAMMCRIDKWHANYITVKVRK